MDGNIELRKPFFSYIKLFLSNFSHPCALDSGNPCRNDGYRICVDIYAQGEGVKCRSYFMRIPEINNLTLCKLAITLKRPAWQETA